jgi:hypothetical protein
MWCSDAPFCGSSTLTQLSNVAAMFEPGYLSELKRSRVTLNGSWTSGAR